MMRPIEYPHLGEPLAVEFANTLYIDTGQRIDFLATNTLVHGWFTATAPHTRVRCPASIRTTDSDHIRSLRDAISQVCRACATNTPLHRHTVATINTYAAAAPAAPVATLHPDRPPTLNHNHVGTAIGITLAQIASAAIELITGPDRALLRICAAHDCSLLFLKHHSRRRWCHDGCGHRDRQARYYRRTTTTG